MFRPASPQPSAADEGWFTRERTLIFVLTAATLIAIYLCFAMMQPFLPAIAWAISLAVVARPVHDWLCKYVKNREVCAGLTVLLVALVILLPLLVVGQQLVVQIVSGVEQVQEMIRTESWRETVDQYPQFKPYLGWLQKNLKLSERLPTALMGQAERAQAILTGSFWTLIQLGIGIFCLFFFIRDRRTILDTVYGLVPLSHHEAQQVFQRMSDTVHATIFGTVVIAGIQGAMGGLIFWFLGLPAPLVWGAIMAVLALIPNVGTVFIWFPTAIVMVLQGHYTSAIILTAWGMLAIGLIDNLLYPTLVGRRLRLHTVAAFFGILGGVSLFGAAGIILGPLVLAVTLALIEIWKRRTQSGQAAEVAVASEPHSPPSRALREGPLVQAD